MVQVLPSGNVSFSDEIQRDENDVSKSKKPRKSKPKEFSDSINKNEKLDVEKLKIESKEKAVAEKLRGERKEKIQMYNNALNTVEEMESIGEKGNLGRGSSFLKNLPGNKEVAQDYAYYEQLGKSLISMASTIPIRNKSEFETLAHGLFDPTVPDSERKGRLRAMKKIINDSIKAASIGDMESETMEHKTDEKTKTKRKPLTELF